MHRVSATRFAPSDKSATAKDDPGDGELSKPRDQRGEPFWIVGQPASAAGWMQVEVERIFNVNADCLRCGLRVVAP